MSNVLLSMLGLAVSVLCASCSKREMSNSDKAVAISAQNQEVYETEYYDHDADADFYSSIAEDFKETRSGAGALLSGFFEGMAHGSRKKATIQKQRCQ